MNSITTTAEQQLATAGHITSPAGKLEAALAESVGEQNAAEDAELAAVDKRIESYAVEIDDWKITSTEAILGIGQCLKEAHNLLSGSGRDGRFAPWVESRCGFSRRTAYRYLDVYRVFGTKCASLSHFTHEALYLLSAESTPAEVTEEAILLAGQGERITSQRAKQLRAKFSNERVERVAEPRPAADNAGSAQCDALPLEDDPEQTIQEVVEEHNKAIESFCRTMLAAAKQKPDTSWLDDKGRWEGYIRKVKQGLDTLRSAKAVVCPACAGEGCKECEEYGFLPKLNALGVVA